MSWTPPWAGRALHVYDFDKTLFRSPEKPDGWTGGWWSNPASLKPPFVPSTPGAEFWVADTVRRVQADDKDPNVYKILMTGRLDNRFRDRLEELLAQKGLRFDEVHLLNSGNMANTPIFKAKIIVDRIHSMGFGTVEMWDDRPELLSIYKAVLLAHPVRSRFHLVRG